MLNLVDNSISHILFKNTRMLFYDKGNDGLSDTVGFLLHNMNTDNFLHFTEYTLCGFLTIMYLL